MRSSTSSAIAPAHTGICLSVVYCALAYRSRLGRVFSRRASRCLVSLWDATSSLAGTPAPSARPLAGPALRHRQARLLPCAVLPPCAVVSGAADEFLIELGVLHHQPRD